jgi:SAM-dependent methyltransferase
MTRFPKLEPLGFDPAVPNQARIHDYFVGGKDNFAADREAARWALSVAPELPLMCREGRRFLERVVRHLAARGVRQFVDVGCGLPTQGNVHEIAQAAAPGSRVVYVDNDPVVVTHARALLEDEEHTAVIEADMREPDQILGHPRLKSLIDLGSPVAILLLFVLDVVPEDELAAHIVGRFRDAIALGGYVAIGHSVSDLRPEATAGLADLYQSRGVVTGHAHREQQRTKADVETLFDGLSLLPPGVVYVPDWAPDAGGQTLDPRAIWSVGGVGRKDA